MEKINKLETDTIVIKTLEKKLQGAESEANKVKQELFDIAVLMAEKDNEIALLDRARLELLEDIEDLKQTMSEELKNAEQREFELNEQLNKISEIEKVAQKNLALHKKAIELNEEAETIRRQTWQAKKESVIKQLSSLSIGQRLLNWKEHLKTIENYLKQ
jgi:hypothetical protein